MKMRQRRKMISKIKIPWFCIVSPKMQIPIDMENWLRGDPIKWIIKNKQAPRFKVRKK